MGRGGAVKIFSQTITYHHLMICYYKAVNRTAPTTPGLLTIHKGYMFLKGKMKNKTKKLLDLSELKFQKI